MKSIFCLKFNKYPMKYGALCFNMKITGKRKEKLISIGLSEDDLMNKKLVKFKKVFNPSEYQEICTRDKEDLFKGLKGVSSKTSRGIRRTMLSHLEGDDYIEANLLREAQILKHSNLKGKVITLDKIETNHKVYAFYLKETVLKNKKFIESNPDYVSGKPCVYVGMTGKSIESRFNEHTNDSDINYHKGSRMMKKFGIPDFSDALAIEVLNHPDIPREHLTFGEALQNEKNYGIWLRSLGYGVWWN